VHADTEAAEQAPEDKQVVEQVRGQLD
jgi:hypothetical protein